MKTEILGKEAGELSKMLPPNSLSTQLDCTFENFASNLHKTRNQLSGKSSVVFAGLVPELQQEGHWKFTHFRPGAIRTKDQLSLVDPFYALATALVLLYEPKLDTTAQLAQASDLADYLRTGKILFSDVITKLQQNYPNYRILLIVDTV